jgi:hypothetical protein
MSKRTRRARVQKRAAQLMKKSNKRMPGISLPTDGSVLLIHGAGQPPSVPRKKNPR